MSTRDKLTTTMLGHGPCLFRVLAVGLLCVLALDVCCMAQEIPSGATLDGSSVFVDDGPPFPSITGPVLFLFGLVVFAVCLVLLGVGLAIGVVVGLAGTACAAVFVACGIVSMSAVVGLVQRRVSAGVRTLHYQTCMAAAAFAGVGVALVASAILDIRMHLGWRIFLGGCVGLLSGLTFAFVLDRLATLAWDRWLGDAFRSLVRRVPTLRSEDL